MFNLGGHAHYLTPEAVYRPALAAEEEAFVTERVSDVARVLSEMGHGISIGFLETLPGGYTAMGMSIFVSLPIGPPSL